MHGPRVDPGREVGARVTTVNTFVQVMNVVLVLAVIAFFVWTIWLVFGNGPRGGTRG